MDLERVDTARPILTPEGGSLTVRVAGPQVRFAAWTIDTVIRVGFYLVAGTLLGLLGQIGTSAMLLITFAGEWLYFALFEGTVGATPGKRRMGVLVVQRDGAPCGLEAAFVRNIVRFVDMLPPFYGFGLLSVISSPDFQRLGDRAAGTLVVYGTRGLDRKPKARQRARRRRQGASDGPDGPEAKGESGLSTPLTVALTGEEEAAILDFAARSSAWGSARQNEVADRLEPLTGLTGDAGARRVLAHAAWLASRGT